MNRMETTSIVGLTLLGIVLVGSLLQTFKVFPTLLDRVFDIAALKITVGLVLILVCSALLLLFLKGLRNREGFETKTAMDNWKELVDIYQLQKLCDLKKRVEEKAFLSFKGSPPDELSDTQARERTEKVLSEGTSQGTINCALFEKANQAKDIDTFFVAIQEVPNTLLIQSYDTAERLRNLLKKQVGDLKGALADQSKMIENARREEGFIDPSVGICSAEIVEERRKFLREKKLDEAAQRCLLPEEVPFESKDKVAQNSVNKIRNSFLNYMRLRPGAPTIDTLLNDSLSFEAELNKIQEDAKSGKLVGKV